MLQHIINKDHEDYGLAKQLVEAKSAVYETLLATKEAMTSQETTSFVTKDGGFDWGKLFTAILGRDSDSKIKAHIERLGFTTTMMRVVSQVLSKHEFACKTYKTDYLGVKPQFYLDLNSVGKFDVSNLPLGLFHLANGESIRVIATSDIINIIETGKKPSFKSVSMEFDDDSNIVVKVVEEGNTVREYINNRNPELAML